MLSKPKTTGPGKTVRFKRRKQTRNKRRPLEAVTQDWAAWDTAAKARGLNWSEFARRAQNAFLDPHVFFPGDSVSEKPGVKKRAAAGAKTPLKR